MPRASCSICHTRWEGEDVRMLHIPTRKNKITRWTNACGITFDKNSRVCEKHFVESDFFSATKNGQTVKRRRLKSSAVPSINLPAKKPRRAGPAVLHTVDMAELTSSWEALTADKSIASALPSKQNSAALPAIEPLAPCTSEMKSAQREETPTALGFVADDTVEEPKKETTVCIAAEKQHTMMNTSIIEASAANLLSPEMEFANDSKSPLPAVSRAIIRECLYLDNFDLSQVKIDKPAAPMDPLDIFSDLCPSDFSSSPRYSLLGNEEFVSLANSLQKDKEKIPIKHSKTMFNADVQTESEVMQAGAILETMRLENLVRRLTHENAKLKCENAQLQQKLSGFADNITSIFTKGQIRKLMSPEKKIHWSTDDMSSAVDLYAASSKAYMLLCARGFPLPCIRTIHKWLQQIKLIIENKE